MKRLTKGWGVISTVVLLAFIIAGCQADRGRNGNGNGNGHQNIATERQDYRQKLEDARNRIDERIGTLRADLNNASEDAKQDINNELDNLNEMRDDINIRLSQVDNIAEDQWQTFKAETDRTMESITNRLKEVETPLENR